MRLDRILANAGYGSRKEVRALIRGGALSLDGRALRAADYAVAETDIERLCLHGEPLRAQFSFYFALHKPAGYLSAMEDARQPCASTFLPEKLKTAGLFPVGRLDIDSTGLLLFTNDGQLGYRLTKPEWHVEKRYLFNYSGPALGLAEVERLAAGLEWGESRCRPARLILPPQQADAKTDVDADAAEQRAELVLSEGKFHQVKRMVAALGREVTALKRLSHGPVTLAGIEEAGQIRPLSADEIAALYAATHLKQPER